MNRGDRKNLRPIEVTRGLTTHGPHTIYPISVFIRGSFHSIRPGREPWLSPAGSGGQYMVDCDHLEGHAIVALEDDSEYHCITPREDAPRFWNRSVIRMPKGMTIWLGPPTFCYMAAGKAMGFDKAMIPITKTMTITAQEDSVAAIMWLKETHT